MLPEFPPPSSVQPEMPSMVKPTDSSASVSALEPLLLKSRGLTQVVTPEIATMLKALAPADALKLFEKDPVTFMLDLINAYFVLHSTAFQQSVEFQAALLALRQHDPAFVYYQQAILQEARAIVEQNGSPEDPEGDGLVDNWITLLLKAKANVEAHLQNGGMEDPKTLMMTDTTVTPPPGIALESSQKAKPKEAKKTITRQQIAKMSREEYLKNETAIKQALKEGRIQ